MEQTEEMGWGVCWSCPCPLWTLSILPIFWCSPPALTPAYCYCKINCPSEQIRYAGEKWLAQEFVKSWKNVFKLIQLLHIHSMDDQSSPVLDNCTPRHLYLVREYTIVMMGWHYCPQYQMWKLYFILNEIQNHLMVECKYRISIWMDGKKSCILADIEKTIFICCG